MMTPKAEHLRVAAISLDIIHGDKAANLAAAAEAIAALPEGTNVAVLPELFTTAFIANRDQAASLAESNDGPTVTALAALATERRMAICGSMLATDPGSTDIRNRTFLLLPSGQATYYDKAHLFFIGDECATYTPGTLPPPATPYLGWNIAMACCFDLRFPCWLRNRALAYDVMLIPANWPRSRAYAWEHLLIARAIENQAYYVGANRGGERYGGMSLIIDSEGRPISCAQGPMLTTSTLSAASLQAQRDTFPAWKSAD